MAVTVSVQLLNKKILACWICIFITLVTCNHSLYEKIVVTHNYNIISSHSTEYCCLCWRHGSWGYQFYGWNIFIYTAGHQSETARRDGCCNWIWSHCVQLTAVFFLWQTSYVDWSLWLKISFFTKFASRLSTKCSSFVKQMDSAPQRFNEK